MNKLLTVLMTSVVATTALSQTTQNKIQIPKEMVGKKINEKELAQRLTAKGLLPLLGLPINPNLQISSEQQVRENQMARALLKALDQK